MVRDRPGVSVSGLTLPWSIMEIAYSSSGLSRRTFRVQADGNGAFAANVPLAEGVNVIEIISFHSASARQARRFRLLTYDPTPLILSITITEPEDGATVANPVLTVVGRTDPEARVVLNDIIPVEPDESGSWQAGILLQPGPTEIRATATLGAEAAETSITVTYAPEP